MIEPALFIAFLGAISLLTVTPGVDTAIVLRTAASEGPRSAVFCAVGIALGCLVWGAAVALGLGALLQVSELAYTIVKWAGAAYLIWLGVQLLLKPRKAVDFAQPTSSGSRALRKGFLTNLLNPKIGVFYVTFLPQFVPHGGPVAVYTFFLAVVHVVVTLVWFAMVIGLTTPLGRLLKNPKVVAAMDRVTGLVFIGFGLKLAASKATS